MVWRQRNDQTIELFVRLTPRTSHDRIDAIGQDENGQKHIQARVRAIPEKGKANKALEKLIAQWLGLPKSTIRVSSGTQSRIKIVSLGEASSQLLETLENKLADLQS